MFFDRLWFWSSVNSSYRGRGIWKSFDDTFCRRPLCVTRTRLWSNCENCSHLVVALMNVTEIGLNNFCFTMMNFFEKFIDELLLPFIKNECLCLRLARSSSYYYNRQHNLLPYIMHCGWFRGFTLCLSIRMVRTCSSMTAVPSSTSMVNSQTTTNSKFVDESPILYHSKMFPLIISRFFCWLKQRVIIFRYFSKLVICRELCWYKTFLSSCYKTSCYKAHNMIFGKNWNAHKVRRWSCNGHN